MRFGEPQRYGFRAVEACDMCGSGRDRHRLLGLRLNQRQGLSPRGAEGIAVSIKRCRDCDLVFPDPQPMPEDLSDHYGTPPESYWTPDYFIEQPDYFAPEIAAVRTLIGSGAGMRALDIGAGIGKCMKALEAAGFETFGLEPSEPFYERALSRMKIAPERLKHAPMEEADYAPASFDFITFGAVLEHLFSPSAALARALRWLKPGGVIQAEVPSSRWLMSALINRYFRLRGTSYVTNTSPMHSPFHLYEFGLRSFERCGERLGFAVARHEYNVCQVLSVPRILHPPLRWWMARTDTGMQLGVYLTKAADGGGPA